MKQLNAEMIIQEKLQVLNEEYFSDKEGISLEKNDFAWDILQRSLCYLRGKQPLVASLAPPNSVQKAIEAEIIS
jgi:hypothetical protein